MKLKSNVKTLNQTKDACTGKRKLCCWKQFYTCILPWMLGSCMATTSCLPVNYFGFWINIAISYSYKMCIDVYSHLYVYTHLYPVLPSKLYAEIYWIFFFSVRAAIGANINIERATAVYIHYIATKIKFKNKTQKKDSLTKQPSALCWLKFSIKSRFMNKPESSIKIHSHTSTHKGETTSYLYFLLQETGNLPLHLLFSH